MGDKTFENKIFEFVERMKKEGKRLSEFTRLELKLITLKHKKDKQLNALGSYIYERAAKGEDNFAADSVYKEHNDRIQDTEKNISKIKKEIEKLKTGQ